MRTCSGWMARETSTRSTPGTATSRRCRRPAGRKRRSIAHLDSTRVGRSRPIGPGRWRCCWSAVRRAFRVFDLTAVFGTRYRHRLRDPRELAVLGFQRGQAIAAIERGVHRGLAKESKQIDEPLLQLMSGSGRTSRLVPPCGLPTRESERRSVPCSTSFIRSALDSTASITLESPPTKPTSMPGLSAS